MFLPYRGQFNFYAHVPRFLYRSRLPLTHPDSIHPALLSAIHLAACSIGGSMLSGYEPLFLSHTRSHLDHSLAHVDKLVHYMWASVILISYYMRVGRVIEAHNISSDTVSLAVGAGIHGSVRMDEQREALLGELFALPPADAVENLERVNLWYALVLCETSIGLSTGFPSPLPADVCACWPLLSMSSHSPLFYSASRLRRGYVFSQSLSVRPRIPAKIFIPLTLSFRM